MLSFKNHTLNDPTPKPSLQKRPNPPALKYAIRTFERFGDILVKRTNVMRKEWYVTPTSWGKTEVYEVSCLFLVGPNR